MTARVLREEGIEYALGVAGGEVLEVLEALREQGTRYISTQDEMSAGFMAEAYYQPARRPGVLVSTLGPRVANPASPAAAANASRFTPIEAHTNPNEYQNQM